MIYNTNTILNDDNIVEFEEKYGAGANLPFNQTTITFAGLANIKEPRIRVIHASFSGDAEETSEFGAGSGWLKEVFELWIDKWTKAIFGLPEIYNPYKASVVKAETNLNVLFGSIDGLLAHKGRGVLTKEVFQKYRGIWGMISNVPVEWVDFILEEKYDVLYASVFSKIENCLQSEDYDNAFYYTMQNKWLEEVNDDFKKVNYIMYLYRLDKFSQGESTRLNGVHSIQELIKLTEAN